MVPDVVGDNGNWRLQPSAVANQGAYAGLAHGIASNRKSKPATPAARAKRGPKEPHPPTPGTPSPRPRGKLPHPRHARHGMLNTLTRSPVMPSPTQCGWSGATAGGGGGDTHRGARRVGAEVGE